MDCGSLPSLDRGEVIQTSTTIGSVANYSCNDRHDLVGVDQRTCLANGAWSDSPPTCGKFYNRQSPSVQLIIIVRSGSSLSTLRECEYNSTATLVCG